MSRVVLLFLDGIGIGENDAATNPFVRTPSPWTPFYSSSNTLPHDGVVIPTQVDLGMTGLPQSATGQTALLCGVNSATEVGRHISGFPTPTLRTILDNESIFKKLKKRGKTGTFVNALSKEYFERLGERISATTRALLAGDFKPRMIDDLVEGHAVSHDLTNSFLAKMGLDVPIRTVAESTDIVAGIAKDVDFSLFEYILSDRIGHAKDWEGAQHIIETLDEFLGRLIPQFDLNETTVVLTSDHGNMEDLGVGTHTNNPVPTCVWGKGQALFQNKVSRIEDITPAILEILE